MILIMDHVVLKDLMWNYFSVVSFCHVAIREDGMPGGRNKSIGPVQVNHRLHATITTNVFFCFYCGIH